MALRTVAFNDTKTYGFEYLRGILEASLQEGVLNWGGAGTDMMVTQRNAGANMALDIAAGAAVVKGDSGTAALGLTQGLFLAINDAAATSAVTLTSDASLPKIAQIVAKIEDSSDLGSAADQVTFAVVDGTPAAGATLDNRNGAAALPNNCLRLADVLIAAGATSLSNSSIRDRRPWARGFNWSTEYSTANISTASTTFVALDPTNLKVRGEFSGVPVLVKLLGSFQGSGITSGRVRLYEDGAFKNYRERFFTTSGANHNEAPQIEFKFSPTAGSHTYEFYWLSDTTTLTLFANTTRSVEMSVEELVRQASKNNSVTSG